MREQPSTILHDLFLRAPNRDDLLLLLAVCIFPTHLWAVTVFLFNMPGLILHMSVGQVGGVLAYILLVTLLESLGLFVILLIIMILLPLRWFSERKISLAMGLVLVLATWAVTVKTKVDIELSEVLFLISILLLVGMAVALSAKLSAILSRLASLLRSPAMTYLALDAIFLIIFAFRLLRG